jgi:hypothetical protein
MGSTTDFIYTCTVLSPVIIPPWSEQIAVCTTPRIATMKMAALLIAKVRSLNLNTDCHWTVLTVCMRPECWGWQSAVHLRAYCHVVIIVVVNRGIGSRELAKELYPAPPVPPAPPPFYIEDLPFWKSINFWRATLKVWNRCLELNYTPIVPIDTQSRDTAHFSGVFFNSTKYVHWCYNTNRLLCILEFEYVAHKSQPSSINHIDSGLRCR